MMSELIVNVDAMGTVQPVPMKVLLLLHLCISFFLVNNIKMQRGKLKTQIKEPNTDCI